MVGPSCKLFVSLCENGDLFKDCYPFNLSWFVSLSRWLERRDGEMERKRWSLTKPACVPVITQSPLFVCLFLGWPKRGGGRGEVKKFACYPVTPPCHTVPPHWAITRCMVCALLHSVVSWVLLSHGGVQISADGGTTPEHSGIVVCR